MRECQDPFPVRCFVHPTWHGVAKDAAGAIGTKTFPGNDENAPSPRGVGTGEKRLQRSMGLVLSAAVKIDLRFDWDLTPAQFGQRSLVEPGGDAMRQFGIGGDRRSHGRHDGPDNGCRRRCLSLFGLARRFRRR